MRPIAAMTRCLHPACLALAALLAILLALPAVAEPGWFRHPAIHGDTIVFTAEGDLWTVAASGGTARRLTSHLGEESHAAISPDGRWLAFSGHYGEAPSVHVMPLAGGQPQQVSGDEVPARVLGWSGDGRVLYASTGDSGMTWSSVVVAVSPQTLEREVLPLADANDAAVDDDGRWLYFTRFGLGVTGDNARGYRGGALAQLWRFDLREGGEAQRIGPRQANLRQPLWAGGRLLVIADLDGRDNLWSLAADGSQPRQLTAHRDFSVRSARSDGRRVVYQHGADLRLLDLADGTDTRVPVRLVSDFDQRREHWLERPLRFLEGTAFAPAGDRVALTVRGQVLLAAPGDVRRTLLGAPAGSRLRQPVLSPDGAHVYAICDATGEEEIWRFPSDGGPGRALTGNGDSRRWQLWLSPDGRWLAHDDKRGRLWLLDTGNGTNRLIDDGGPDGNEGYAGLAWSPDSRHLVLARQTREVGRDRLALYSLADGKLHWLTSDRYHAHSPVFSPDGKWLWFLSDRQFELANGSPWGDRNTGPQFNRRTRIYALALQPGNRFPFLPETELSLAEAADEPAGKGDRRNGKDPGPPPALEREGLAQRLYQVPLPGGEYRRLRADRERLYFLDGRGRSTSLKYLPIGNRGDKPTQVIGGVAGYDLSADGSKLFLHLAGDGDSGATGKPPRFLVAEAASKLPEDRQRITIGLDDWTLRIDPPAEWRQMFADAWRLHRDHFYDPAMRGVDWPALRQRYQALLPRVSDRLELDDLLAQMMAELGALHSQVRGGDFRQAPALVRNAHLGARLSPVADGLRIDHILRGPPELPDQAAPLAAPGVDARPGDVITAVNGRPVRDLATLTAVLHNQAGRQVLLELRRGQAGHRTVAVAVDSARLAQLRYSDWVESRRERVAQAGDGRIGYLHLYAMGGNDMAAFARDFYAQFDRPALIVDVRRNRGGNIDSWVIEKLLRRAWAFWQRPHGQPYTNMQQAFRGHLVVLTDALTYSDGETFAAGVQALGLAPLIGTRTAGAGIWLTGRNTLVDRGLARVSEFPQYDIDGRWLIEGVGVQPDIEVDNLPHATFNGGDAQLDAAIDWLQRRLAEEPVPELQRQPIPALPWLR